MTSPARNLALALGLLLTAAAQADAKGHGRMADGYSRPAEQVLADARNATGGAGWNMLRGIHTIGHLNAPPGASGGTIRFETWSDPLRYGLRTETHGAAGVRIDGFNGQGDWSILPDGRIVTVEDPAAVDKLRTEAFLAAGGVFYTSRFEAHGEVIGAKTAGGRTYDVLNVQPWGGASRELWFDRATHLLTRIVDRTGPQAVTTELSDYRRVGPVKIAFHTVVRGPGAGEVIDRQLDSVVFAPADRSLFSLPRPDAAPTAQSLPRSLAPGAG
jgi:hypothetical protein